MDETLVNRTLDKHIRHDGGSKTVCVSTCLNFFGIPDTSYHYTSSKGNVRAYVGVLRRFGYSVRSKKSEFKATKCPTMTELKRNMRKSSYTSSDYFIVCGQQKKSAHLMVLDGNGKTIIDTAKGMKWRITQVCIVEKK
jgi:hypothetical protein